MKKLIMNHRFWATLFWVNALCLATASSIPIGLLNAFACWLCICHYNSTKPK